MAQQLESSPIDRHKAQFGEKNQANYLILAKEKSFGAASDKLNHQKKLFDTEIREEVPTSPKQNVNFNK
jgi:hypothetical protein